MERKTTKTWIRCITVLMCALLMIPLLLHQSTRAAALGYGDRFGYSQLTTDVQRRAYAILEEQVGNLSTSFVVNAGEQISMEDVQAASDALMLDRMDFFYFLSGCVNMAQFTDGTLAVNPRYVLHNKAMPGQSYQELAQLAGMPEGQVTTFGTYMVEGVDETSGISLEEIRAAKGVYEGKVKQILQSIPADADTAEEKAKYLHDYLANSITYQTSINDQNAYSGIVEGRAVCAGYAKSYQDLLSRLGIKCWYISGYAGEDHAWNVLWLNGECVYTDVTWADQITYIRYSYYNISKEQMAQNHTMDAEYAAVLGSCNHNGHKHQLTPENVAGSVAHVTEKHYPTTGYQLTVDYSASSNSVTFHSSDPSVVTVTDNGCMTAVGNGSAVVTVILHDLGCADQYRITVGSPQEHTGTSTPETKPTQPPATVPKETTPAPTQPAQSVPVQTTPAPTQPAQSVPVQTTPAPTQPAESVPAQTTPAPTQPTESVPAQTQPAGSQPTADSTTPATTVPDSTTSAEQNRPGSGTPTALIVLCVIIVLLGVSAGAYLLWKRKLQKS